MFSFLKGRVLFDHWTGLAFRMESRCFFYLKGSHIEFKVCTEKITSKLLSEWVLPGFSFLIAQRCGMMVIEVKMMA
jgi:hypothetical protein